MCCVCTVRGQGQPHDQVQARFRSEFSSSLPCNYEVSLTSKYDENTIRYGKKYDVEISLKCTDFGVRLTYTACIDTMYR